MKNIKVPPIEICSHRSVCIPAYDPEHNRVVDKWFSIAESGFLREATESPRMRKIKMR